MEHNFVFPFLRVVLKPLSKTHLEELRILRNKESRFFLTTNPISKEKQKKWFANYLTKQDDIMFYVAKKDNPDVFIGAIAAYDINFTNKTCEIGRVLIDKQKAPEKGIGTDAVKAICAFCFDVLGMNKVIAIALKDNKRILKVDSRVGFKVVDDCDDKSVLLWLESKDFNRQ